MANTEYFKGINKIPFEGSESDNPFAFKYYNPDQIISGKTMRDHFKFAIAIGILLWSGTDPFGAGTQNFPWDNATDSVQAARDKAMQPLSLSQKWGLIITVSMIMIWFRGINIGSLKKE